MQARITETAGSVLGNRAAQAAESRVGDPAYCGSSAFNDGGLLEGMNLSTMTQRATTDIGRALDHHAR